MLCDSEGCRRAERPRESLPHPRRRLSYHLHRGGRPADRSRVARGPSKGSLSKAVMWGAAPLDMKQRRCGVTSIGRLLGDEAFDEYRVALACYPRRLMPGPKLRKGLIDHGCPPNSEFWMSSEFKFANPPGCIVDNGSKKRTRSECVIQFRIVSRLLFSCNDDACAPFQSQGVSVKF